MAGGSPAARPEDVAFVRAALEAVRIRPSDAELAALAEGLPSLRDRVAALYAVDCGDGEPALLLSASEEPAR